MDENMQKVIQYLEDNGDWFNASVVRVANTCDNPESKFYGWQGNADIKKRANQIIMELHNRG